MDNAFATAGAWPGPAESRLSPLQRKPARVHRWRTPGTCGELLQGALDGRDFMVNCPIDLYATATAVATDTGPAVMLRDAPTYAKVRATLELLLADDPGRGRAGGHGPGGGGVAVTVASPIPRSKGMASSTADAASALAAVAACRGIALDERRAARLLTAVEPSDCTHFSGVAHLDFITGELIDRLPPPRGLQLLVVDCGGEVHTLGFDRAHARAVYAVHRERLAAALRQLSQGLRSGCNRMVAEAASVSTELSQIILPKAPLPALRALAAEMGVLGINCAHSGTVLGLLYEDGDDPGREERLRDRLAREFGADLPVIGSFHVIGGGSHAVA